MNDYSFFLRKIAKYLFGSILCKWRVVRDLYYISACYEVYFFAGVIKTTQRKML